MKNAKIILILLVSLLPFAAEGHYGWQRVAPMNIARRGHAAVAAQGKLYVFGGAERGQMPTASVEVYDPDLDRWERGPELPGPIINAAAVTLGGYIFIIGGATHRHRILDGVSMFDPESGRYRAISTLPQARHSVSAVAVADRILVMGGVSNDGFESSGYWFTPNGAQWGDASPFHEPRAQFALVRDNRLVWSVGGFYRGPVNVVEQLRGDDWNEVARLPIPLGAMGAVFYGDTLVVAGGTGRDLSSPRVFGYLPRAQSWFELPSMEVPRTEFPLVELGGRMFAVGGWSAPIQHHERTLDLVEMYGLPLAAPPMEGAVNPAGFVSVAWPCPANGAVTISLPPQPARLILYDAVGRRLWETRAAAGATKGQIWDAGSSPAGTYHYTITTLLAPERIYTGRIIVVK